MFVFQKPRESIRRYVLYFAGVVVCRKSLIAWSIWKYCMFLILKCCLSYVETCRIVPATKPSLTFLLCCQRHDCSRGEVWKTVNMEARRDPAGSPGCRVCRKRKMEPIFVDEEWYCCGYKTAGQHHHNNETLK